MAEENKPAEAPQVEEPPSFNIEKEEDIEPCVIALKNFLEKHDLDIKVNFRPKKARPDKSRVNSGKPLDNGEVNIPSKFTVELMDNTGKPIDHGDEDVKCVITDPAGNTVPCEITDNKDGTYQVDYTPTVDGDHKAEVTIDNQPLGDSPYKVHVDPAEAVAENCIAQGEGLTQAQHAAEAVFEILTFNKINERIPTGGFTFDIEIEGPSGKVEPAITDRNDGTYEVKYTPKEHGKHTIKIQLKGKDIKDSPFELEVERNKQFPDPSQCVATGPGVEGGFDTADVAKFVVESRMADGEKFSEGGFPFKADVTDPEGNEIDCPLVDNGDGTYSGEYKPTKPGEYTVEVKLHNKDIPVNFDHIKDSPFHPKVDPGVDAEFCYLDTDGFADADDVTPTCFKIFAKDCLDQDIKEGGHPFKVSCVGPDGEDVPVDIKDNGDGSYDCQFQAEKPGRHRVRAGINDEDIKGTPVDVDIAEGVSNENSGIERFSFTIQARNKRGEALTKGGRGAKFSCTVKSDSVNVEDVKIDDMGDGKYHVVYKVEEPGTYTINCMVNRRDILGSPWKQTVG